MTYFNKRTHTIWQVVGLLTIMFLGSTVISYAAVNIPNTFTPDTTISASQMNANFTAVANQMPGVAYVSSESYISVPNSDTVMLSIDVAAPTDGYIVASFSGNARFNHTNGATDSIRATLSTTCPGTVEGSVGGFRYSSIPSDAPTGNYYNTIASNNVFAVSSGTTTICVIAETFNGLTVEIGYSVLQAIFVPNRL